MQTVGAEIISEVVTFLKNINDWALLLALQKALPLQEKQNKHFLPKLFKPMESEIDWKPPIWGQ